MRSGARLPLGAGEQEEMARSVDNNSMMVADRPISMSLVLIIGSLSKMSWKKTTQSLTYKSGFAFSLSTNCQDYPLTCVPAQPKPIF